jgi:ribosomal protein L30E
MSILEGVRAANIKAEKPKFIIKARNNPKDGKEDYEPEPSYATDEDAIQFMEYMINKSQRLR